MKVSATHPVYTANPTPEVGFRTGALPEWTKASICDTLDVVKEIDRDEVRRLMDEGAQIVETLGREEWEDEHLPGAISIPLRRLKDEYHQLDPSRPVVVYCWDSA